MRSKLLLLLFSIVLSANGYAEESMPGDSVGSGEYVEDTGSQLYQVQTIVSYHQVAVGETLYRIARINDVSVEDLKIWNDLTSNNIIAGTQLKIQKTEYIPVGQPQLVEPESLRITLNEEIVSGIMKEYIVRIEDDRYNSDIYHKRILKEELESLAEINIRNLNVKPKTGIWDRVSNVTTTAFTSVKGWGKSVIGKNNKTEIPSEILYADNTAYIGGNNIEDIEAVTDEDNSSNDGTFENFTPQTHSSQDIDYKSANEKKNIWKNISNTAGTAFSSVKDWGKSVVASKQDKEESQLGVCVTENYLRFNANKVTGVTLKVYDLEKEHPEIAFLENDKYKKVIHKVRIGETMTQIATRYNVSQTDIVKWNHLSCNIVNVKHRLLIFVPKDFALAHNTVNGGNKSIY